MNNDFFWIGGKHAVLEAIKNKKRKYSKIFTTNENKKNLVNQTNSVHIKKNIEIDRLFKDSSFAHQGYAALIKKIPPCKLDDLFKLSNYPEKIVVLDGVFDPRNVGSIIRSCVAFNVNYILIKEKNYLPTSFYLYKSASGALEHINIVVVTNISNSLNLLKKNGYWIYGADGNGNIDLKNTVFKDPKIALVLGSENKGISPLIKKNCDYLIRIKISEKIESLNVANTCAIFLSHI
jgi:23S rRNA (guanosine2251-2'-O)-methyltransferase